MSGLLGSIFAAWWPQIAAVFAGVAAIAAAYLKGQSTERRKNELEDANNADQTRKVGAEARDRVADDVAAGKLRDSDGWRRS